MNDILAALYINKACALAEALELEDFPIKKITELPNRIDTEKLAESLFLLLQYMNEIQAKILVYRNNADGSNGYIELNEDWRSKATSYVAHIRGAVSKADIKVGLRESILKKLDELQAEIDRERTRLNAAVQVWFEITDAIGKGAKNLEPAAALTKKVVDAFAGLWKESQAESHPKLPPPDSLGLPDLSEDEKDTDSNESD